jgi:hypothetical protein
LVLNLEGIIRKLKVNLVNTRHVETGEIVKLDYRYEYVIDTDETIKDQVIEEEACRLTLLKNTDKGLLLKGDFCLTQSGFTRLPIKKHLNFLKIKEATKGRTPSSKNYASDFQDLVDLVKPTCIIITSFHGIIKRLEQNCLIDTENKSASLYSLRDFNVLSLEEPFSPERYIKGLRYVRN